MRLLPSSKAASTSQAIFLSAYKEFPNTSQHNLPLIIYRPFEESPKPDEIERLVEKNGYQAAWRYGMFPYNHYHSNTHEVLVPYSGTAELAFGHSDSPDCYKHEARPGDVYILPAGVVHRSLKQSNDFSMVGSYPADAANWDNCRGGEAQEQTDKRWKAVKELGSASKRLQSDPVYGRTAEQTPLSKHWASVA